MEWTTHFLSGLVAGYVVSGDWKGAAVGGIAGVIPDLDEHRSKFGKMLFPISFAINKSFGHRTFTHSLLFVVIVGVVLMLFFEPYVWLSSSAGILAHIVGDMVTGRVKFLYPWKKSIGIKVSRLNYQIIDKITAIGLLALVVYIGHQYISLNHI